MPKFRVVGTMKKTYLVDVDEVVEAADEYEACDVVTDEVILAQPFDSPKHEWQDCGPDVFPVKEE